MTTNHTTLSDIELNNQFEMGRKLNCKRPNSRVVGNGISSIVDTPAEKQIKLTGDNRLPIMENNCHHSTDAKMIRDEPKLSKEDPQETRHIKQLLLLHLDWIQQQQELLIAKDKQIQRLKQEKDTLKCRLERMDRRMSLLKSHNRHSSPSHHETRESRTRVQSESPAPSGGKSDNHCKGIKRKQSLEPQNLGKRFDAADDRKSMKSPLVSRGSGTDSLATSNDVTNQTNTTPRGQSRASRSHRDLPHKADNYLYSQQPLRRCRVLNSTSLSEDPEPEIKSEKKFHPRFHQDDSESDEEIQFKDRSKPKQTRKSQAKCDTTTSSSNSSKIAKILHTDTMYYVPVQTNLAPWEISPKKPQAEEVLVPTFRVRHIPTGYQLEGTENLTDEAFLKRHQKPEQDEKRRKRWDAQMLREQKMLERLQQRSCSTGKVVNYGKAQTSKPATEEPIDSFLPDPDDVKYVEICEEIPVNAFGYPVPTLEPAEFSLPWYEVEARTERGKATRSTRKR